MFTSYPFTVHVQLQVTTFSIVYSATPDSRPTMACYNRALILGWPSYFRATIVENIVWVMLRSGPYSKVVLILRWPQSELPLYCFNKICLLSFKSLYIAVYYMSIISLYSLRNPEYKREPNSIMSQDYPQGQF